MRCEGDLISITFGLKWAFLRDSEVRRLLRGELGQFHTKLAEMEGGDLFVELLWEDVDLPFGVLARVLPKFDLSNRLIGE